MEGWKKRRFAMEDKFQHASMQHFIMTSLMIGTTRRCRKRPFRVRDVVELVDDPIFLPSSRWKSKRSLDNVAAVILIVS